MRAFSSWPPHVVEAIEDCDVLKCIVEERLVSLM
jgi:hypothetical protein